MDCNQFFKFIIIINYITLFIILLIIIIIHFKKILCIISLVVVIWFQLEWYHMTYKTFLRLICGDMKRKKIRRELNNNIQL